jgi:hypothetical protein
MGNTQKDLTLFELTSSGSVAQVTHRFDGTAKSSATVLRDNGSPLMSEEDTVPANGPEVLAEKVGGFLIPPTGRVEVMQSGSGPLRLNGKAVATTASRVRTDCQVTPICPGSDIFQDKGDAIRVNGASVIRGQ